jgi:hypothetical protein
MHHGKQNTGQEECAELDDNRHKKLELQKERREGREAASLQSGGRHLQIIY